MSWTTKTPLTYFEQIRNMLLQLVRWITVKNDSRMHSSRTGDDLLFQVVFQMIRQ